MNDKKFMIKELQAHKFLKREFLQIDTISGCRFPSVVSVHQLVNEITKNCVSE